MFAFYNIVIPLTVASGRKKPYLQPFATKVKKFKKGLSRLGLGHYLITREAFILAR